MAKKSTIVLVCALLLSLPASVEGGPISYVSCMATKGVGAFAAGPAILGVVGFGANGIVAGPWAARWMASFGGSLFATLQSTCASGIAWSAFGSISGFCAALTATLP